MQPPSPADAPKGTGTASQASRARILMVDDTPANLLALESILERLGHVLVRATSGEDALRLLNREEYAVVLMDVRMPGVDGLQAAALMKQRARSRRTPIILLSAHSGEPEDILRGYHQGAVDYLVKPVDADVLCTKVSVFVDLYLKAHDIERQAAALLEQERLAEALRARMLVEQHARQVAEEGERTYRNLGESIPQQVWAAAPDGSLDQVNGVVVRYFGRPAERMLGDGWQGVIHPDDLAVCVDRWTRSIATGEPYEVEFRLLRSDGAYRWHIGRAVPVRADDGRLLRWFGTNTDIDDQIVARRRAEESERNFRTLAETMPQMCWSSKPDGAPEYYNERWLEYTGEALAEALSPDRPFTHHHPEVRAEVAKRWRESLASGEPFEIESPLRRAADGMYRLHLIRATALRDADGTVTKWVGTCTDIHDQRQLVSETLRMETREREMRQVALRADISAALSTRDELRPMLQSCCEALVRHLGVAFARIWTIDPGGDVLVLQASAGRYTHIDGAHAAIRVGDLKIGLIAKERQPHLTNALAADGHLADPAWAAREGMTSFAGYPLIVGDRVIGVVAMFAQHALEARTLDTIGAVAGTLAQGIVRRWAEAALDQRAAELARSNAELERFAYIASHDLQEPLRMVASYTQLLGRRYRGKLDQDADEFIAYAVDGANRMQALINDLLAFSRVGTKGAPMVPAPLSRPLDLALSNLSVAIAESGAQVTRDELPVAIIDQRQVIQLFQNLIANAIKFRGSEPPRIHVGASLAGEEWRIAVKDNGIGIDPQFFGRLFVLFQRLHTTTEYDGTGIGLAICKKIVDRHGGRIWVESTPGLGSTFTFTVRGAPT